MSWSKITLIGFENWLNDHGKDLFENLILPEGIEKDILCNNILLQGGEYEVLFANPEMLVSQIGYWGRKNFRTFQKWIDVLSEEYNPLYNLDVFEEWEDSDTGSKTRSLSGLRQDQQSGTETTAEDATTTTEGTASTDGTSTTENLRSAMDASTYQPHDKSENTTSADSEENAESVLDRDQTVTRTSSGSGSSSENENISDSSLGKHNGHRYGNQGITMSQDMLIKELEVVKWNIYEHITDMFLLEFTIPVYE